ncbi:PAS/PAC sensor signal transduction histidine kinase [Deinococcus aerius]|uniref:histidine kinase n=1 Tax=Deinococcus aerius TaxID=200253 RepID=A0A2I9DJG4_9DEIO|nr:PAS domain S-box protein [Deinococcus aerius]GBF04941.1 PAS/PAC sensor signal transduction histidine kinase [Deinococcus aerius]
MTRLPRRHLIPLAVFVLVLALSVGAALLLGSLVRAQQQARFDREVSAYTFSLRDRLSDYENLLRATRAFWRVRGGPDQAAFGTYVDGLDLEGRYPGVLAVGFIRWEEGPGGRVRAPITRIAPLDATNRAALGFDMMTDATRREAILRARDREASQVSRQVRLVQRGPDGERLDGLLLFLPVREGGTLRGMVYLALQTGNLLAGLAPPASTPGLTVRPLLNGEALVPAEAAGNAAFGERTHLDAAGATWALEFSAPGSFGRDVVAAVPVVVLVAGLLVAGLAFLLTQAQVRARERAEEVSQTLRESRARLERSRAEFEAIFQAIQDSAAFTDAQGRVRLVNRALTGQFGYPEGALLGEPLALLHLDRRLEGRAAFQAITTPYRRADGSVFSGEAQRSEVIGPHGEVLGVLEVVRDVTERIEAERAVQAEERRSRAVLDAIPHILWVSDPSGNITYVNAQHRERLGRDYVRERVHPEDRPTYDQMWEDAYAAGTRAQGEVRLAIGEGRDPYRWFVLRVAPIHEEGRRGDPDQARAEGGGVTEWVASATDIHDRLVAERLAQRNEERSRGVLEGMPQIVWLTDPQGRPTYFNRRWEEYVGRERAGYGFLSLLHPEDRAEYRARWAAAVESGRPFEAEHRLLGADGRYRTFVTRGLPVRDAAGQVLEWVGTSTDVDDQVYAEAAARLLADVSERLSSRADDPLASRAEQYRAALDLVTGRLAGSAGLWGRPPGLPLLATSRVDPGRLSPAAREAARAAAQQVVGGEEPLFVSVSAFPLLEEVSASGAVLYPLLGQDGAVRGVLGLAYRQTPTDRDHDLAQELAKRFATALDNDALRFQAAAAQADLQLLNQSLEERVVLRTLELQEANRELEAFSYSVSHDLRTPLRHIVGFGDLLRKEAGGTLSPKGERYLGVITDAAARMSRLIDDLLEFSRMGRQELRRGPVDLGAVVREAWAALEHDREGRAAGIEVGPLPTVEGDAALLTQVFTNLLSNALKYTRTRGQAQVQVTAREGPGEVTVTVRDNGVGFDPRYTDKLFGVFQRLHRAEEFEGTGIGLANVRRIVTRHGGRVSAESVPGEGAAFHVTLPLGGAP